MGFLDKMKRAMGFASADYDEPEVEGIDATVTPLRQRVSTVADGKQDVSSVVGDNESGGNTCHKDDIPQTSPDNGQSRPDASVIFDGVVGIFNNALPDFLRESVDPVKQRQLLYDALDRSMKDYFDHLEKNVERRLHVRYQAESMKLQEQIEELRQKARKEEEGNSNAKNLQLSAERQKRALSERVHELEKQLASIEAENEQYILENKTMANKLRLASLTDRDVEAGQEVASRLEEAERKMAESESRAAAAEKALRVSEAKVEELTAAVAAKDDSAKVAGLEKEMAALRETLAQANAKEELNRVKAEDLAVRLTKAQEDLKIVREVQEQVLKLEENQRISDAELRRQKDELMEKDELIRAKDSDLLTKNTTLRIKDETIRRLEDQADSLRKSIETAQYEKTQTESALRSEIERLKAIKGITDSVLTETAKPEEGIEIPAVSDRVDSDADLALDLPELVTPEIVGGASAPKPRRGRPPKPRPAVGQEQPVKAKPEPKQEEDDFSLLDSTDWLIAAPSPDNSPKPKRQRKQKAEQADDAFGYKEPVRQEPPDNPAQMLLW